MFWLPIEQYQKDGRIIRGLQRGANSFSTSTAMAALELTARIVYAIQVGELVHVVVSKYENPVSNVMLTLYITANS